jgi:hypothetical protein
MYLHNKGFDILLQDLNKFKINIQYPKSTFKRCYKYCLSDMFKQSQYVIPKLAFKQHWLK